MKRFLQYSLERNRAIRIIYLDEEGRMRQITAVVTAMDDHEIRVYVLRPPKDLTISVEDILSCDYRKGDEGGE